ncbi:MAG: hypothetical protein PF484_08005 [Bacteroidales bacterium]|jgi:hypothetical protein|nr:hypothetical protein [Bacteroidales bacterium]
MKRNWIRKLIGGLSLTSAMFVFQACYGTPQDFGYDIFVEGKVTSKSTGLAIPGIQVVVGDNIQFDQTNEEGYFSFYTLSDANIPIHFKDIDGELNGSFVDKEIVVSDAENRVYLNVDLQEE